MSDLYLQPLASIYIFTQQFISQYSISQILNYIRIVYAEGYSILAQTEHIVFRFKSLLNIEYCLVTIAISSVNESVQNLGEVEKREREGWSGGWRGERKFHIVFENLN